MTPWVHRDWNVKQVIILGGPLSTRYVANSVADPTINKEGDNFWLGPMEPDDSHVPSPQPQLNSQEIALMARLLSRVEFNYLIHERCPFDDLLRSISLCKNQRDMSLRKT